MRRQRGLHIVLALALLLGVGFLPALVGVTKAQDETPTTGSTVETKARVIHAATNTDPIKVSFDGDLGIDDLEYGQVSDFVDIDAGDLWVKIEEAGLDVTDYIYSATFPYVPAGNNYQLILSDDLVQTQLIDISPLGERVARARLIHSSAATPTIDIVATGGNLPLITGVHFPQSTDYVELPSGTYDLQLVQSGTTTVLLDLPGTVVDAGTVYDFVVIGTPGDDDHPLSVITATTPASS
jgi:hypothetical protein